MSERAVEVEWHLKQSAGWWVRKMKTGRQAPAKLNKECFTELGNRPSCGWRGNPALDRVSVPVHEHGGKSLDTENSLQHSKWSCWYQHSNGTTWWDLRPPLRSLPQASRRAHVFRPTVRRGCIPVDFWSGAYRQ